MSRGWLQALHDDLEYQRAQKELYLRAMLFAVGKLFELGREDIGRNVMKKAGLSLSDAIPPMKEDER